MQQYADADKNGDKKQAKRPYRDNNIHGWNYPDGTLE
jgi:hypothetical protein